MNMREEKTDLVNDCPGVFLRDGGGEGVEDLVQTEAVLGVQLTSPPAWPGLAQ